MLQYGRLQSGDGFGIWTSIPVLAEAAVWEATAWEATVRRRIWDLDSHRLGLGSDIEDLQT